MLKKANLKLVKELIISLNYFKTIKSGKKLKAYFYYLLSFLAKVISALALLQRTFTYNNL
jgi:hypothetical protein